MVGGSIMKFAVRTSADLQDEIEMMNLKVRADKVCGRTIYEITAQQFAELLTDMKRKYILYEKLVTKTLFTTPTGERLVRVMNKQDLNSWYFMVIK